MPALDMPRVRVTMRDGSTHDVQTENPDMVYFDLERAKRKWPGIQEAPFLWLNYLAYSKLKRDGALANGSPAPSFETWLATTVAVINIDEEGNAVTATVTADPTQEGPAPDSLLR